MEKIGLTFKDLCYLIGVFERLIDERRHTKEFTRQRLDSDELNEAEREEYEDYLNYCLEDLKKLSRLKTLFEQAELL